MKDKKLTIWTEFEKTFLKTYPNGKQEWITESNFYMHNWLGKDLSEQWQTKAVEGKKFEMIPIALCWSEGNPIDWIPKTNTKYKQYLIQFTESPNLKELNSKLETNDKNKIAKNSSSISNIEDSIGI